MRRHREVFPFRRFRVTCVFAVFCGFLSVEIRNCPPISYPQVSCVKQCFIEETCAKPFFVLVGLVMFFNES